MSAEDGEALIARVHLSNLPAADAEKVEWVIRMYFYVVFALQEAKLSAKRLRSLLFGKSPAPSPAKIVGCRPSGCREHSAAAVCEAADAGAAATAHHVPPGEPQRPEQAKPQGGHRPGTGRLGADAYVGATRIECRHEELAVGQRCPVCGQGISMRCPPGWRYALTAMPCSAPCATSWKSCAARRAVSASAHMTHGAEPAEEPVSCEQAMHRRVLRHPEVPSLHVWQWHVACVLRLCRWSAHGVERRGDLPRAGSPFNPEPEET